MLSQLAKMQPYESRSITAENPTGAKGAGAMEVPKDNSPARELGVGWKVRPNIGIAPGETVELANIDGPGIIKHIWITGGWPKNRAMILRIYWEDSETPSVECPLGDFFAAAEHQEYVQLTSLPVCVNPKRAFNCYWDMPFYKKCRITLENQFSEGQGVWYQIDYIIGDIPKNLGYFHAQFRRVNPLPYKEVYTILDNVEGNGHYVGTYLFWGVNNNGWWGEGEVKFYLDGDTDFPTICGTGTEDYFGGSWDFVAHDKYQEFCTPFMGLAKLIRPDGVYHSQQRFSLYRWHINDPIYFKKNIKVTVQALGWRQGGRYLPLQDDISSVAFWYQDSICKTFPKFPTRDELEMI